MADGELTLNLDQALAKKIADGALAAGLSQEAYAAQLIEQGLFSLDDYVWDEDPRRAGDEDIDGQKTYPLGEVMAELRSELEKRLAAKA